MAMVKQRYENTQNGHFKFWEVEYPKDGNQPETYWRVTWGRIGTAGQSKMFGSVSPAASRLSAGRAHGEARAKVAEKIAKGYCFVNASGQSLPPAVEFQQGSVVSLPIQKVKLTPTFQNHCGGNKPIFCDVIARPGSTFCPHCNGTGKFMRAFGRLDPCRLCGGSGESASVAIAAVAAPIPVSTVRQFDWSE